MKNEGIPATNNTSTVINMQTRGTSGKSGRRKGVAGTSKAGSVAVVQEEKPPAPKVSMFDPAFKRKGVYKERESQEKTDFINEYPDILKMQPQLLKRRERMGTRKSNKQTLAVDRMYLALLRLTAHRAATTINFNLAHDLDVLYRASDWDIYERHLLECSDGNLEAIMGENDNFVCYD
ncbi:hypothetical protein H4S07_005682 [Coemansia furcata]|uniref:Uncharacterized protein n=1 Tax=Coemansia furcata TaxID=417177 RepID=A0ACC1L012_9FUNG|nr:hypothetical protein H4S07_005682 [Coemansia furcata]